MGLPVLDAHSLYLETLAELGPLGFALLLCALAVPFGALGAARSARRWEPWSAEPWRFLGEAQLQAGSVEQARTSFLRGIRKDRGDWELWLDLALATRGSERQAALGRVATLNPLSTELRDLRGSP